MGYPQRNPVKICLRRQNKGKSVERGGIGADLLSATETDAGDHWMLDKGIAHIGIGYGKGDDKALEAVKEAVSSPLLETTIAGASHVIINISGDITLMDASDAAEYVQDLAGEEANRQMRRQSQLLRQVYIIQAEQLLN